MLFFCNKIAAGSRSTLIRLLFLQAKKEKEKEECAWQFKINLNNKYLKQITFNKYLPSTDLRSTQSLSGRRASYNALMKKLYVLLLLL